MDAPRILLLGTYPCEEPRHGGQRRVHAIAKAYLKAGWEVRQIAAFPHGCYAHKRGGSSHIEFHRGFSSYLTSNRLRTDVHAYHYFAQSVQARESLLLAVERFQPDVIQFEHPWLFPVFSDQLKRGSRTSLVVYSAHNVESELLRAILMAEGHPRADEFVEEARCFEDALVTAADLTICVTDADAAVFRSRGAQKVIVAANGADRRPAAGSSRWGRELGDQPFAFVAGSAHPPNCSGFLHFLGSTFAFVPPDGRVVVAGGMGRLLAASTAFQRDHEMARRRAILAVDPTEDDLNFLINRAAVVLLPIAQGGGSNIKTAEALLTDRPIIGSSIAFRGYEDFRDSEGVVIEDNAKRFRQAVRTAICSPHRTIAKRDGTETLLWEQCVSNIPQTVAALSEV